MRARVAAWPRYRPPGEVRPPSNPAGGTVNHPIEDELHRIAESRALCDDLRSRRESIGVKLMAFVDRVTESRLRHMTIEAEAELDEIDDELKRLGQ